LQIPLRLQQIPPLLRLLLRQLTEFFRFLRTQ
jgi:hypothetical protein